MFLKLNQTLGASYEADQDDVRTMKTALAEVSEYTPPQGHINGCTDDAMFDGMKRFQKKKGLRVDGVARPGGPTETNLNSALASGANPGLNPAGRDHDHATRSNLGAPKVFDVSAGIGPGQANTGPDVQGAKHTLAWAGYYPKDKARSATGEFDEDLAWGLLDFQRDHGLKQDGLMLPGGESATTLDTLVAPLVRATFGAEGHPGPDVRLLGTQEEEEPTDPPPKDCGDGDGKDEPDNDHDRKCAEYQRQVRELWRRQTEMNDAMLLLGKDIANTSKGPERDRYVSYVMEMTDYVHRPSRDDRIRHGDLVEKAASAPNQNLQVAGAGALLRKGIIKLPPVKVPPATKPKPAPAPPGGGGPKPPVMAPPVPPPGGGGDGPPQDRDPTGYRDPSGIETIIEWLTEPSWFDEIRKFNIEARDVAADRARSAHEMRLAVIAEAIKEPCQIDEMPSLGSA